VSLSKYPPAEQELYGCGFLKGPFRNSLKAKATATVKATRCKTKAYSRNCQNLAVSPADLGISPFVIIM